LIVLNIAAVLDKMQEYGRNWLQHIQGMPRVRLPRIIKKTTEQQAGKNQGRPLKRFLDVWDWNVSTSGPTP
jgi:hypothetical protein